MSSPFQSLSGKANGGVSFNGLFDYSTSTHTFVNLGSHRMIPLCSPLLVHRLVSLNVGLHRLEAYVIDMKPAAGHSGTRRTVMQRAPLVVALS